MARISVLFATRNGAHTLPRMLATLERLRPPSGGWNVIAVDNGSSDETSELLRASAARLPMTVVAEERRGKNSALNTGLALIDGDVVAFTDDDTILPPDWLSTIETVAAQQAGYDIFGGPIYPVWEQPPPDWVQRGDPRWFLGVTDVAEGEVDATKIWGANMAVRARVFAGQKFAENFAMHSETEFTARANRRGHRCWHFGASPVGHIIRPYQLEPGWHGARAYEVGRANRRRFYAENEDGPLGSRFRALVNMTKAVAHLTVEMGRLAETHVFGKFDDRVKASLGLRHWRGCLDEDCATLIRRPASPAKAGRVAER